MASPLLALRGLTVAHADAGAAPLLARVDLELQAGRVLGLAGESGCGKSLLTLALLDLLPPGLRHSAGSLHFGALTLTATTGPEGRRAWRQLRGRRLAIVFQDPYSALNPLLKVGAQVSEPLRVHRGLSQQAARLRTLELLAEVELPRPAELYESYPHMLSGGMRQRALLAMALACDPELLVADEPTTALDVTVQAQVVALLRRLQRHRQLTLLFVSHDLALLSQVADDLAIMYAGRIVEHGEAGRLLHHPRHPYTAALLAALPHADAARGALPIIAGNVPHGGAWPAGCPFHPRCPHALASCASDEPVMAMGLACFAPLPG